MPNENYWQRLFDRIGVAIMVGFGVLIGLAIAAVIVLV